MRNTHSAVYPSSRDGYDLRIRIEVKIPIRTGRNPAVADVRSIIRRDHVECFVGGARQSPFN